MVKCFSFCLYGDKPKYTIGMCRNVQLINQFYPDWRIYIALGTGVPADIEKVLAEQPNVVLYKTGKEGGVNMHIRFFVIDHPDVELMVVRDADSRIHARDRWCINRWLALGPGQAGHGAMITRDHINHNNNILGGLWGIRKGVLPPMAYLYKDIIKELMSPEYKFEYGDDQNILSDGIYPLLVQSAVVFTDLAERVYEGEYTEKIGEPIVGENFCGQVVDFDESGVEKNMVKYVYMINGEACVRE
jgi:hypothetical protein